mgnify:CR=1 FL=1
MPDAINIQIGGKIMDSQETFSQILKAVKILVSEKKAELYKECNFDVLIDTETAYRVIIEFDNCMGEILVNQPYFAPYRFVKIEMLSSVCVEDTHIFIWYDSESDSVDEILFQIRKCFDIAKKYNGK